MSDNRSLEERRVELAAYRRSIGWSEQQLADEEYLWQISRTDPPYATWFEGVDRLVRSVSFGIVPPRVAYHTYRDWFDQGISHLEAARQVLDDTAFWERRAEFSRNDPSWRYRFWKRSAAGRRQTEATPAEQRDLFWRWLELVNEHICVAGGGGAFEYRGDFWEWFNVGVPAHAAAERAMKRPWW